MVEILLLHSRQPLRLQRLHLPFHREASSSRLLENQAFHLLQLSQLVPSLSSATETTNCQVIDLLFGVSNHASCVEIAVTTEKGEESVLIFQEEGVGLKVKVDWVSSELRPECKLIGLQGYFSRYLAGM